MTLAEIVQEVSRLSRAEQLRLVQLILDSLSEKDALSQPIIEALDFLNVPYIVNPDGRTYTDEEVEMMRMAYLQEKYL